MHSTSGATLVDRDSELHGGHLAAVPAHHPLVRTSILFTLVTAVLLGIIYPLIVTGIAMGIAVKREHYDTTLGARPTAAEDGAAALRVVGRHHLQAIRYYPNNSVVADLYVTGNSCVLKIEHRLKPGKRQYTFSSPMGGLAYCERPRTVRTSCEPI